MKQNNAPTAIVICLFMLGAFYLGQSSVETGKVQAEPTAIVQPSTVRPSAPISPNDLQTQMVECARRAEQLCSHLGVASCTIMGGRVPLKEAKEWEH